MVDYLKRLPSIVELGLVVLAAWLTATLVMPEPEGEVSQALSSTVQSSSELPDLQRLLSAPLFGALRDNASSTPKTPAKPTPVTLSPLHLTLLGTVVAGRQSAAMIEHQDRHEQQLYFIGDAIEPGVILREVTASYIEVARAGKRERITMDATTLQQSTPTAFSPATNRVPPHMPPRMMGGAFGGRHMAITPPTPTPTSAPTQQKQMTRAYIKQQTSNFAALMTQARAQPYMLNGRPQGFVLTEIANGSLYQKAGLKNGDVIQRVNGKQVMNVQQAMAMYQTLQTASAIDIDLLRNGQPQRIHYVIR